MLLPYRRICQINSKLQRVARGIELNGFDPKWHPLPNFVRYMFRDIGKDDYKRGKVRHKPPTLSTSQRERFYKLLSEAYCVRGAALETLYKEISLFVKRKFAENEKAFHIKELPDGIGCVRRGLFVWHVNPDGKAGGSYEATIHFHGDEKEFVIMRGCRIVGTMALHSPIKLFHKSKLSGSGIYKNCIFLNNSRLYNCKAENAVFINAIAKRSEFGSAEVPKTEINHCIFVSCKGVVGSHKDKIREGDKEGNWSD
ncbi:MAG: hypothetical protein N3E51_05070 [Candidatus Micrarchaeota archaeon]|nr:hypothetical protein [Candidatus Micrarchaeota archaeon]